MRDYGAGYGDRNRLARFFQVGDGARLLATSASSCKVLALRDRPLASPRVRSVLPAFWRHFGHGDCSPLRNEPALGETSARVTDIRYTAIMTSTLDAAIAKLAALPPDEQDRVGRWLLHELADDEQWTRHV